MSQNRQSAKDRAKADADFRVNLKNEVGIEKMLAELGAMRAETNKRLEILERPRASDRVRAEVPAKMPGGPLHRRSRAAFPAKLPRGARCALCHPGNSSLQ